MTHVIFDHFTTAELTALDRPERWELDEPTYLVMMFLHPDGRAYFRDMPKKPPLDGMCLNYFMDMSGRTYSVVSLLYYGVVRRIDGRICVVTGAYATERPLEPEADLGVLSTNMPVAPLVRAISGYVRGNPPSVLDFPVMPA